MLSSLHGDWEVPVAPVNVPGLHFGAITCASCQRWPALKAGTVLSLLSAFERGGRLEHIDDAGFALVRAWALPPASATGWPADCALTDIAQWRRDRRQPSAPAAAGESPSAAAPEPAAPADASGEGLASGPAPVQQPAGGDSLDLFA